MKNKAWNKIIFIFFDCDFMRFDFWTTNYVLVIPNQALEGFSILLRGGFYRGIKSVGEVLYLSYQL